MSNFRTIGICSVCGKYAIEGTAEEYDIRLVACGVDRTEHRVFCGTPCARVCAADSDVKSMLPRPLPAPPAKQPEGRFPERGPNGEEEICDNCEERKATLWFDGKVNDGETIRYGFCSEPCVSQTYRALLADSRLYSPKSPKSHRVQWHPVLESPFEAAKTCWAHGCKKVGQHPHIVPQRGLLYPCDDHLVEMCYALGVVGYVGALKQGQRVWLKQTAKHTTEHVSTQPVAEDDSICYKRGCEQRGIIPHTVGDVEFRPCAQHFESMVKHLLGKGFASIITPSAVRWLPPTDVERIRSQQAKEEPPMPNKCFAGDCSAIGAIGHQVDRQVYYPCSAHLDSMKNEMAYKNRYPIVFSQGIEWVRSDATAPPPQAMTNSLTPVNGYGEAPAPKSSPMAKLEQEAGISKKLILGQSLTKTCLGGYKLAVEKAGGKAPKMLQAIVAMSEAWPEEAEIVLAGLMGGMGMFTPGDKPELLEDALSGQRMSFMAGVGVKTMEAIMTPGMEFLKSFDWKSWMPQPPAGILDYTQTGTIPQGEEKAACAAKSPEVKQ